MGLRVLTHKDLDSPFQHVLRWSSHLGLQAVYAKSQLKRATRVNKTRASLLSRLSVSSSCLWLTLLLLVYPGPEKLEHIKIRILKAMVSGVPFVLGLGARILCVYAVFAAHKTHMQQTIIPSSLKY